MGELRMGRQMGVRKYHVETRFYLLSRLDFITLFRPRVGISLGISGPFLDRPNLIDPGLVPRGTG